MKTISTLLSAAALAGALFAGAAKAADYPAMNLRFASYVSATIPQSQVDLWWAEEIEKRSGGQITIQFFWSQSLGKASELLALVAGGAVELAAPSIGYHPDNFPLANVSQLPMVLPDNRIAQRVAEAVAAVPAVEEEFAAAKVVPLVWHSLPTYHALCNKEIHTVEGFRDIKIRSYGKYVPMMWTALGAAGVTVLAPEMYEGLQRGNIDCTYISNDFAYAYKLQEVTRYIISANFGAISAWATMVNAELWQSWPEEVRTLFLEVSREAAEREREAVHEAAEQATQAMLAGGMTLVDFAEQQKLQQTVPDFLEVWVGEMRERGKGEAAAEIAALVRKTVAEAE